MAKGSIFKKLLASVTAAALFCCAAISVSAETSEYVNNDKLYSHDGDESIYISDNNFLYNFKGENPGVTICGYVGDSTEIDIPHLINGREVSAIDKDTFTNDKRIVSVSFPNSVKSIGENSFNGCPNLKTVNLAFGISQLNNVFCDCPALESMKFPQGVNSIFESFKNCTSLSYIRFARSVTSIGEHSFSGCTALKQIDWLGGIIKLHNAFDGCTSLESVSIPSGVVLIDGAFDGCTSLKKITFPDSLLYITGGFSDCTSLKELTLPDKLLFVNEAFNNCDSLTKLECNHQTKISETAFLHCPKLVIKREKNIIKPLLLWTGLILLMGITGYFTFRLLTYMSNNMLPEQKKKSVEPNQPL